MTAATSAPERGGYEITEKHRILICRLEREWTQADLVRESGMSRGTISRIENGHKVTRRARITLALVFGVSAKWLETGELAADGGPGGVVIVWSTRRIAKPRILPSPLMEAA